LHLGPIPSSPGNTHKYFSGEKSSGHITYKILLNFYATPARTVVLRPCESATQHFLTIPTSSSKSHIKFY
jgi:hypothetical protein